MERDYLIVLNYQREVPPFMLTQLRYASRHFKKVYYVTRDLVNDNSGCLVQDNIEIIQAGSCGNVANMLRVFPGAMRVGYLSTLMDAAKHHVLSSGFVKTQMAMDCGSWLLSRAAERLIVKHGAKNCVVLAAWFMAEAYAAALLKQAHPDLRATSFAHSFEVQKARDRALEARHLRERHDSLDAIYFISRRVFEGYFQETLCPMGLSDGRCKIHYLGSERHSEGGGPSRDGLIRIVTCSGLLAIKRIGLLIEGLSMLNEKLASRLCWTHIGGGPEEESVSHEALRLLNGKIDYKFLGHMENSEVHHYYETNSCDLFINVSAMEGLPVSLMESISYGIPVVATDVGGSSEIVIDGETGFLLGANPKPQDIAEAITLFAYMEEGAILRMRANCKTVWKNKFDAENNAYEFYTKLGGKDL